MTRFSRAAAVVVAVASGAIVAAAARWEPDSSDGYSRVIFTPSDSRDPGYARATAVAKRIAAKDAIVGALIRGELRLTLAVQQILALNREWPQIWPFEYDSSTGRSLEERVARLVIDAANGFLRRDPSRAAVAARLERELADAIRNGEIPIDGESPFPIPPFPAEAITSTAGRPAL
ncbi:hypothetical protein [Fimbriiglobus ruber]|uniref:Uncharacterized protein n=1 Tax=Fimbriiglobus ruber TaxID=1908690 RepID=A0A225DHA5_9BACT|nr:hypothetical protein [Fimbriiglobus ruber]OWK39054.1 hypothetical protein FRUB_06136 [Fimbriiglobus ruber]